MALQRSLELSPNGVPTLAPPVVDPAGLYASFNPYAGSLTNGVPHPEGWVPPAFETTGLACKPSICAPEQFSRGCRTVVTDSAALCVPLGSTIDFSTGSSDKLCSAVRTRPVRDVQPPKLGLPTMYRF